MVSENKKMGTLCCILVLILRGAVKWRSIPRTCSTKPWAHNTAYHHGNLYIPGLALKSSGISFDFQYWLANLAHWPRASIWRGIFGRCNFSPFVTWFFVPPGKYILRIKHPSTVSMPIIFSSFPSLPSSLLLIFN